VKDEEIPKLNSFPRGSESAVACRGGIPEPSTLALFSFGLLGMFGFLRKRRKA